MITSRATLLCPFLLGPVQLAIWSAAGGDVQQPGPGGLQPGDGGPNVMAPGQQPGDGGDGDGGDGGGGDGRGNPLLTADGSSLSAGGSGLFGEWY